MGRTATINADDVFAAANRLEMENKDVTALELHRILGRGSLGTIYKHLDRWRAERSEPAPTINIEMPELVKNAFALAWREASRLAAAEVQVVKNKSAEEVKAAVKEFQDARKAIEQLEEESERDAQAIDALTKQVSEQRERLLIVEADYAGQKATSEELRSQAESQQSELVRLHAEVEKERMQRDLAIKEAAELRGRLDALTLQNDQLLEKLTPKKIS